MRFIYSQCFLSLRRAAGLPAVRFAGQGGGVGKAAGAALLFQLGTVAGWTPGLLRGGQGLRGAVEEGMGSRL